MIDTRDSKKGDWGGRKIRQHLLEDGMTEDEVPAVSMITAILHHHSKMDDEENQKQKDYKRFEADEPNDRWQMDFLGHFAIEGGRRHPMTVLDDSS